MIGETILQYQVLEKLGAGGMGVVYKALDTQLNRTVALKFLPEYQEAGEIDRARFLQEARAASAINHPNVCVIYDLKEHKGEQFIVMEYVEGKTLKQLTADQELIPVDKAVDYALQIADAMQAAHDRGILHRDIKSENIMVTLSGQIKVMDFGLALVKGSQRLTRSSSTVGTIAYMSPEQIEGKSVDARADIFSFGVVFYELLTGNLPFTGDTHAAVIYAILNNPPTPMESYRQLAPEMVDTVYHALEKDVNNRFQSFQEIREELLHIKQGEAEAPIRKRRLMATPPARKKNPFTIRRIMTGAALLLVLSFMLNLTFQRYWATEKPPMNIVPLSIRLGGSDCAVFSPDNKQVAFNWGNGKNLDIYIQQISTNQLLQITNNPADDLFPSWSPDGQQIAFYRASDDLEESGIYLISSIGGTERKLLNYYRIRDLSWSPDGHSLVYSVFETGGVHVFDLQTGKERQVFAPKVFNMPYWASLDPEFSPDGKYIAYIAANTFGVSEVNIIPSEGGNAKQLTHDNKMCTSLTWTPDGKKIIFSSNRATTSKLWSMIRDGSSLKLLSCSGQNCSSPDVSNDGRMLVFTENRGGDYNIGRIRLKGRQRPEKPEEVIATQLDEMFIDFSPSGKEFTFCGNRSGFSEIWKCNMDGTQLLQLTELKNHSGWPKWSPDGTKIAFDSRPYGNTDIFVVPANGGQSVQITKDSTDETTPSWSSDGKWLYYLRTSQGDNQIWRIPSSGGAPMQVTYNGGFTAYESNDGKLLYFLKRGQPFIWQCLPEGGDEISLFEAIRDYRGWSVAKDGILFIQPSEEDSVIYFRSYNFASKKISTEAILEMLPSVFNPQRSPDNQWLYFSYLKELPQSSIMLAENYE